MSHFFDGTQNLYETMRVHFPEIVMFKKLVFDPDLGFFLVWFNHPPEVDLFIPKIEYYGNFQRAASRGKIRR
jgi:hypothetical protein